MTLLQTVFSAERIIQVSDRRLTLNGEVFDDEYTKLVCWNQTFTVGFTGIARQSPLCGTLFGAARTHHDVKSRAEKIALTRTSWDGEPLDVRFYQSETAKVWG